MGSVRGPVAVYPCISSDVRFIVLILFVQSDHSIPLAVVPKDQLREGLASFKDEAKIVHPVQKMLESSQKMTRTRLQEQVYGSALPAKASIEKQILSRYVIVFVPELVGVTVY